MVEAIILTPIEPIHLMLKLSQIQKRIMVDVSFV
jgi:hypothetical protein